MESSVSLLFVLVIGLGIFAQWLAWRLHFPAIILLALAGLIVGPGLGLLQPSKDLGTALPPIIGLSVAIILFEGGLNLRFTELREAAKGVRRLVTIGAALNFVLGAIAAHFLGGLSWAVSLVLGAILVVTGPTVIMPLLRQAMLNRRSASYLKWEAIINDPVGALLAVLMFQFFVYRGGTGAAYGDVFISLGIALLVAGLLGAGGGYLAVQAFRRAVVPEYLKAPVLMALVLVVFVASNAVQREAGLLTVTIMGITVANLGLPSLDEMRRFKEYITVVLVSSVFVVLSANVDPLALAQMGWRDVALVLAVMFVVRPLAIQVATIGSDMSWRDRLLVSWIAPRGIVAAMVAGVFAPELVHAGYADAELLVPVVFSVIFATVLVHGLSLGWLGRRLGLSATGKRNGILIVGVSPWTIELGRTLKDLGIRVLLVDTSWHRLRGARLAGLPVYFGEVLSERALESLELFEFSHLIVATSNDAYNALVCSSLAPEFGQEHVYQLPMYENAENDRRGLARGVRGRIAFDQRAQYEELWRRHYAGWKFQKTRLTESFKPSDLKAQQDDESFVILKISPDGDITVHSVQTPVQPKPGDTIVTYGPADNDRGRSSPAQSNAAQVVRKAPLPDRA